MSAKAVKSLAKHLHVHNRGPRKRPVTTDDLGTDVMEFDLLPPAIANVANPFLRLLMEEAYMRDMTQRLQRLSGDDLLPGYNIPAFRRDPSAYKPPSTSALQAFNPISLHTLEQVDRERKQGKFKSLQASDLFAMGLGFYSFDTERGLMYMRQAALTGDVRAQALYEVLATNAKAQTGGSIPPDTLQQWYFDALATGFTLMLPPTSDLPQTARVARSQFYENSGFNSAYFCGKESLKTAQSFQMQFEPMTEWLRTPKLENYSGQLPTAGPDDNTILHFAVLAGDIETIEKIIKRHEDRPWLLNTCNKDNETPLIFASRAGNAKAVKLLIEGGATALVRAGRMSPLHWLFAFPPEDVSEVCDLMIGKGLARADAVAPETPMFHFPFSMPEGTPLAWAVAAGSLRAVDALSNRIVSIDNLTLEEKERCFVGAMKLAVIRGEYEIMKAMVNAATAHDVSLATVASEGFSWSVISVPEDSEAIPIAATPLAGDWRDSVIRTLRHGSAANIEKSVRQTLICVNSLQGSRVIEGDAKEGRNLAASFMCKSSSRCFYYFYMYIETVLMVRVQTSNRLLYKETLFRPSGFSSDMARRTLNPTLGLLCLSISSTTGPFAPPHGFLRSWISSEV